MDRVAPEPTALTRPYWEGCAQGELRLQRCDACRRFIHLPEYECPFCGGSVLRWERVSGRGVVDTYSVVHRTFAPGFDSRTPYVIAWIELEEQAGLRVFGNVLGRAPESVAIGLQVEVVFERLGEFGPVPNFRASHGVRSEEDEMADDVRVGNVLYPAGDVDAAVAFYGKALGLAVKFQDGARFAALDGGGTTLALAGAEEDVTGGRPAASFKVADVPATVERLLAAGAALQRPAEEGPHEVRAVLLDPWGNPLVVYSSR